MYIVTGGAGFIGSAIVAKLNSVGVRDILVVDDLGSSEKWRNLNGLVFEDYLDKEEFIEQVRKNRFGGAVRALIHMGACSTTTERNADYLINNNFKYSRTLAEWCRSGGVRFVYASSAATYGSGSEGYDDDLQRIAALRPLNLYGYSKQLFDLWVVKNGFEQDFVGLKFFNVYGPNEYHKAEMRSVVCKAYEQIRENGRVKLFQSNAPAFADGEQKRDFIYVKDCAEVVWWLVQNPGKNGIYNLGTGQARSWNDLVRAIYAALGLAPNIEYVPLPSEIAQQYQNFTEAKMDRLKGLGCPVPFTPLDVGVADYVKNYLVPGKRHLEG